MKVYTLTIKLEDPDGHSVLEIEANVDADWASLHDKKICLWCAGATQPSFLKS